MNNKELQDLFKEITTQSSNNIFDIYISLDELKEQYKQSVFYKKTHKDIYEAYRIYMETIGKVDYILSVLTNADDEKVVAFLDKIAETFDLNGVLNQLEGDNRKLFEELLPFVKM